MTVLIAATSKDLYPELVTAAKALGEEVVALAIGPLADQADGIAPGADRVLTIGGEDTAYMSETATGALAQVAEDLGASTILVGGNRRGKEIAPRLAARLEAAYVAVAIDIDDEGRFKRKYMGGQTVATEEITAETTVATIAPHAFDPASGDSPSPEDAGVSLEEGSVQRTSLEAASSEGVDIEKAEIVVAFGRGVKEEDDMELIFDLAEALGGEVGCTRPIAADLHWLGDDRWIGLSGKVVKPKVYLACGISGQIQHLAGCRDSDTIVVINTDENAPFFEHADYGIVGDLYDLVPALTKAAQGQ